MLSQTPDQIVSFGDSLSDAGALFGATSQVLLAPLPLDEPFVSPGYDGVLSNGLVYTQVLHRLLEARHFPFAVAGAQAIGSQDLSGVLTAASALIDPGASAELLDQIRTLDINLGGQVARFTEDQTSFPNQPLFRLNSDAVTAATVLIGLNDFTAFVADQDFSDLSGVLTALTTFGAELANSVTAHVTALASDDRLDQLILIAPPGPSFFPLNGGVPDGAELLANAAIDGFRDVLDDLADQLASPDLETIVVDLAPIAALIEEDGATFGLSDVGPFYFGSGSSIQIGDIDPATGFPALSFPTNPDVQDIPVDQLRFFDEVHPTATTHGVFGAYIAAALKTEIVTLQDSADSTFRASNGNEVVLGRVIDEQIALRQGKDTALASAGDDLVSGGRGSDLISGGSGDDTVLGGSGRDVLTGGTGTNDVRGGGGRDTFFLGRGDDVAKGGAGKDMFIFVDGDLPEDATVRIIGNGGTDRLVVLTDVETATRLRDTVDRFVEGRLELDTLGIVATGIEQIIFRGNGATSIVSINPIVDGLVAEADQWGFF